MRRLMDNLWFWAQVFGSFLGICTLPDIPRGGQDPAPATGRLPSLS